MIMKNPNRYKASFMGFTIVFSFIRKPINERLKIIIENQEMSIQSLYDRQGPPVMMK